MDNVTPFFKVRQPEHITIFFAGYLPLESEIVGAFRLLPIE